METETNAKAIAGAIIAVLLIMGAAIWFDRTQTGAEDAVALVPDTNAAPASDASAAAISDGVPASDIADMSDTADTSDTATELEPAPQVSFDGVTAAAMPPAIDTFFRNPDETTVIAGRATPGQTVAIMLGNDELDRVTTGPDGAFGAIVLIAAADQPRRLRLIGDPDGQALASAESVIVPPSAPVAVASAPAQQDVPGVARSDDATGAPVVVDESTGRVVVTADVNGAVAPAVSADSPVMLPRDPSTAPDVSAPPTLIADADGVRVIQRPEGGVSKPAFVDNIALDTITYDTAGEVILAGRAEGGGFVQIYLDNKPVTTSRITSEGDWQIDLPDVDTGVYTLRVDELDVDGNVQSRIETPFKREEPATVAAIMADETAAEGFDVAVRTVQPGATLWAIAEEQFGDGIMYVAVFEANRDQIRNPDLIYPGQVFRLPEIIE